MKYFVVEHNIPPPRNRPIIIIEGKAYRLRECNIAVPYSDPTGNQISDRYSIDMVTTSGEEVAGDYRHGSTSYRPSGRLVFTLDIECV